MSPLTIALLAIAAYVTIGLLSAALLMFMFRKDHAPPPLYPMMILAAPGLWPLIWLFFVGFMVFAGIAELVDKLRYRD